MKSSQRLNYHIPSLKSRFIAQTKQLHSTRRLPNKMSYFTKNHAQKLLYNKFVVVIGDSVQRAVYKDLVGLLTDGNLLLNRHLKSKGEESVFGDTLIERSDLTNGKWYREVRQYHTPTYLIRFYFVTRCYSDYVETILLDLCKEPAVDVVVMNSCLWDVSRYGHRGMSVYQDNLQILFSRLQAVLPPRCLTIWHTAMPVGKKIQTRGFLLPDIAFLEDILTLQVREGNYYACQVAKEYGVDIIDLHWFFKQKVHMLVHDGIHWNAEAHRRITNILLSHLCAAWDIAPPPPMDLPPLTSSSAMSDRVTSNTGRKGGQKRGHVRCNSLPDSLCGPAFRFGSGNNYERNNNNWFVPNDCNNNNSNMFNGIQHQNRSNNMDTFVQMSQGVRDYNFQYGFISGRGSQNEFWKQRPMVGSMKQNSSSMRTSTGGQRLHNLCS